MEELLFNAVVGILIFFFLSERLLDYLNDSKNSSVLPDELKGIYDEEKYAKSQAYDKETSRFSLYSSTFSLVLMLGMLFYGGFAILDDFVRGYTENPILMALLFFGLMTLGSDILGLPFDLYSTFVIEEKYGFNKTTAKTYILDKIKGALLGAVLGGGILSAIVWFYMATGDMFWVYTWAFISAFMIFMAMFHTTLFVPLFNKLEPIKNKELAKEIKAYCDKVGFNLSNLFQIDGSKRSSKANAYFSGLGGKKTIVLFDTLIENHTIPELVAVLAHEVGHYKKKHIYASIVLGVLQMGVMLFVLSLLINNASLSLVLGSPNQSFHLSILVFGLLYTPISMITGIFMNMLSRKNEYEADRFAADTFGGEPLMEALKKLSVDNLSNLRPHPLYVFLNFSHPTLMQRLGALKSSS
ncbi:MAG: M48 family metallopeptidase [Flavobacteriales bacterium]|nr:M48 family metallopeptidase [Flavobacteriales bacterium]